MSFQTISSVNYGKTDDFRKDRLQYVYVHGEKRRHLANHILLYLSWMMKTARNNRPVRQTSMSVNQRWNYSYPLRIPIAMDIKSNKTSYRNSNGEFHISVGSYRNSNWILQEFGPKSNRNKFPRGLCIGIQIENALFL